MDLLQEVSGAKRIGISGHVRPDGDCVGSCLALWQYLKKVLPDAEVTVYLEAPQKIYEYLKGYGEKALKYSLEHFSKSANLNNLTQIVCNMIK